MNLRVGTPLLLLAGLALGCGLLRPATVPPPPPGAAGDAAAISPDAAGTTAAAAPRQAVPGTMVALPGGSFRAAERVGPNADPAFYWVKPFELDATEVTVAEYARCVRAGRCKPASTTVSWSGGMSTEAQKRWSAYCNGEREDRADHPVNCVDWEQAKAYCESLGKRLPLEEEWEWAARGASGARRYPWGDAEPAARPCWSGPGNDAGGKRQGTCPVASHPAGNSPEGIADLSGNVWEWTATGDVAGMDSRGRGVAARVARGGGWADSDPKDIVVGRRAKNLASDRGADLGFRCARSR